MFQLKFLQAPPVHHRGAVRRAVVMFLLSSFLPSSSLPVISHPQGQQRRRTQDRTSSTRGEASVTGVAVFKETSEQRPGKRQRTLNIKYISPD